MSRGEQLGRFANVQHLAVQSIGTFYEEKSHS